MRIALIGRDADRVLAFRGSLIRMAQNLGHEVIAITAPTDDEAPKALAEKGVRWHPAPLQAGSLNPFADLVYRRHLVGVLRDETVDAVLAYNPKCLANAPLAARKAGVRRVVGMVTGLGHGFIGNSWRERMVRWAKVRLYRAAFQACDTVLIQNESDRTDLLRSGALAAPTAQRVRMIAGSGVDLDHFSPSQLPEGVHFLMVARPLREKGLPEFFEAARQVHASFPEATFAWLGPLQDPNPSTIRPDELQHWLSQGVVRHMSPCADIRPALSRCTVLVLPSHREGTSKVALEALASGRCLITSNAPGCGHVIESGESGIVVPVGSVEGLVDAMHRLALSPSLMQRMARASRERAEKLFGSDRVDAIVLSALIDP